LQRAIESESNIYP